MLTKIAAPVNIFIGIIVLLGELWLNAAVWSLPGVEPAFDWFKTLLYYLYFLSCPICLILGSARALEAPASKLAPILYSVGGVVVVWNLSPAIYEGFHPQPLVYVNLRFTYAMLGFVVLVAAVTCCLLADFIRLQRAKG